MASTRSTKSATSASSAASGRRRVAAGGAATRGAARRGTAKRSIAKRGTAKTPATRTRAAGAGGETGSAADFIPSRPTLPKLRAASRACRGCHLWRVGTQTVFGEGPAGATVMFVGEQPGDREDLAGHPFVGPSGRLLDAALEAAQIDRGEVYVTNAVKHFKWERGEKGKRRIHKTPNSSEIRACHPWLDAEIALVQPRVIVCLGATAARALLGKDFKVTQQRGKVQRGGPADAVIATVHPSSVLRAPDPEARAAAEQDFIADVKKVAAVLRKNGRR